MQEINQLLDLQKIDIQILKNELLLADTKAKLLDDSSLQKANASITRISTRIDELNRGRRASENEIGQINQQIKSIDRKLYGGIVTNPKELSAAEEEKTFTLVVLRQQEDKLLELMLEIDEAEIDLKESTEQMESIELSRPVTQTELLEVQETLVRELDDLGNIRQDYLPGISESSMASYNDLRGKNNGVALSKVEKKMCQECRITLPTAELQLVKSMSTFVHCSSCGCILYMD